MTQAELQHVLGHYRTSSLVVGSHCHHTGEWLVVLVVCGFCSSQAPGEAQELAHWRQLR